MESIYWVPSRDCNQKCPHCYNDSGPGAPGLSLDEVDACVRNLPDPDRVTVGRFILSGGEVLVWPELLFHALGRLRERYGERTELWVQTNGDLLDGEALDRLLDAGVSRVDVASQDRFHVRTSVTRRPELTRLFEDRGLTEVRVDETEPQPTDGPRFAFWGATEDEWIGPLWPRGRAVERGLSKATPEDRFCSLWSGAKSFLDYDAPGCEVNVQLSDVYPCCPMTCRPIGNLLEEPLLDTLDRLREHPVFRALNEGRPEAMGEALGLDESHGFDRSRALGNHCLWCDEFFTVHAPELLESGARTARSEPFLVQLSESV